MPYHFNFNYCIRQTLCKNRVRSSLSMRYVLLGCNLESVRVVQRAQLWPSVYQQLDVAFEKPAWRKEKMLTSPDIWLGPRVPVNENCVTSVNRKIARMAQMTQMTQITQLWTNTVILLLKHSFFIKLSSGHFIIACVIIYQVIQLSRYLSVDRCHAVLVNQYTGTLPEIWSAVTSEPWRDSGREDKRRLCSQGGFT